MKWTKVKTGVYKAEGTNYTVESVRADGPWIIRSKGRKRRTEFKTMREAKTAVDTLLWNEGHMDPAPETIPEPAVQDVLKSWKEAASEPAVRASLVAGLEFAQRELVDATDVVTIVPDVLVSNSVRPMTVPIPPAKMGEDMSPMPARYRVVLSRIGRHGRQDLGEITIPATSNQPGQDVAFEIHKRIRSRHLLSSSWFEVEADLEAGLVRLDRGRFGEGTVTRA